MGGCSIQPQACHDTWYGVTWDDVNGWDEKYMVTFNTLTTRTMLADKRKEFCLGDCF